VLLPSEAAALNALITAGTGLLTAFSNANAAAVAAGASLGANPQADATFATSAKVFITDLEAALKALKIKV
jgi:hypothetical protein